MRRYSLAVALGAAVAACGDKNPLEPNYVPSMPVFSNPTEITNPYLPLFNLSKHTLEGTEAGASFRVVRTSVLDRRMFTFNTAQVATVIIVDSAFVNGVLSEVAVDYFAQSDAGDVYYFGEDVDIFENGQVVSHEGAWRFGVNTTTLGLLMPTTPVVGQRFRSEDVPGITTEDDEVVAIGETVTVPAGTFQNCVRIKETLSDGAIEYKLYAPNVGVVQEIPEDGLVNLISYSRSAP